MTSHVLPFVKATACGNDFLVVEQFASHSDLKELTRKMCDRQFGIGADGVEWLFPDTEADIQAQLLNADGSEAEISGNGTRCVAAFLCAKHPKEQIVVRTGAGLKACKLISQHQFQYEFETAMGEPQVGDELSLSLKSGTVKGIPVSMGNPHYVIFVDEFDSDWQQKAAEIGGHSGFHHGVNVELVKINNQSDIDVRFFERGVGETQSSGTGSCAAAVAAFATGRAMSPVKVNALGGNQSVKWQKEVFLTGPAQLICRGEFFIK